MHELPITQSILNIALHYAEEQNARHISHLYLVIGSQSTIMEDSVQLYWGLISRGTIAEGAALHFERVPSRMMCFECGYSFQAETETFVCPACQSARVQVAADDEFRLDAIDIETEA